MGSDCLSAEVFSQILSRDFDDVLNGASDVAVAVSGGADSVALCHLLCVWAVERGIVVHALTVDHGLRDEAADEAAAVGRSLADIPHARHQILAWDAPSQTRRQEEARKARYALMAEYCAAYEIGALFLGHHMDDQAETVLFRLAKGSGLDGLCGMRAVQCYDERLQLCRPLLGYSKEDLVDVCEAEELSYVDDPSNVCDDYARVRLRKSRAVLEEEGLSSKRLAMSAKRFLRAREALGEMADKAYETALEYKNTKRIVFNIEPLIDWPEEIVLRVVLRSVSEVGNDRDYAPRMEKVEALVEDIVHVETFRKRTLGGVIFSRDDAAGLLRLEQE